MSTGATRSSKQKEDVDRKGSAWREKKSSGSGSLSAARSQSPAVPKIDGPGEVQSSANPVGDCLELPRNLQVMPWDRKEWETLNMRPRRANCGKLEDLAYYEPGEGIPKGHPIIRMKWKCTDVFCSGDKGKRGCKAVACGGLGVSSGAMPSMPTFVGEEKGTGTTPGSTPLRRE